MGRRQFRESIDLSEPSQAETPIPRPKKPASEAAQQAPVIPGITSDPYQQEPAPAPAPAPEPDLEPPKKRKRRKV